MNKLEANNLVKSYRKRKVVDNISIFLKEREVVGLLGPNGAGKTTTFYMMVGLIGADQGTISFNNRNITHYPIHKRAKTGLGYLPQEPSIFQKLSAENNIKAILQLRKDLSSKSRKYALDKLVDEFHLHTVRKTPGISLSGGERRRVEIARALAMNPKFILLDEPFAGIDPIAIGDIKEIITHLQNRNIGILITDHNVRETLDICVRAYIIHQGSMIAQGSPEVILKNLQVREVYLGDDFML